MPATFFNHEYRQISKPSAPFLGLTPAEGGQAGISLRAPLDQVSICVSKRPKKVLTRPLLHICKIATYSMPSFAGKLLTQSKIAFTISRNTKAYSNLKFLLYNFGINCMQLNVGWVTLKMERKLGCPV